VAPPPAPARAPRLSLEVAYALVTFPLGRAVQNGVAMTAAGYYSDQYVKVNDEWRFQSRDLHLFHFVPVEKGWAVEDGKVELGQR